MKQYRKIIITVLLIGLFALAPFGSHFYIAHADILGISDLTSGKFINTMFAQIAYAILSILQYLVGISGLLLNAAVKYGILNMREEITNLTVLNTGWTLVRDVGNIFFIGVLLYIAIATILNIGNIDTKRTIRNVIIVALLVNFSLFITKILIDASNIFTISFYNLIVHDNGSVLGFAEQFTRPLGLSQFGNSTEFVQKFATGDSGSFMRIGIVAIGGSIFMFMVAVSFLYAAFLLTVRFVILIILMILSPIAFFFSVLPSTSEYFKRWFGYLRNQLVFAPVYMLLLYIVMLMNQTFSLVPTGAAGAAGSATNTDWLAALLPSTTNIQATLTGSDSPLLVVLRFVIMIMFLNLAGIIAQSAAKGSGSIVSNSFDRIRNTAFGFAKTPIKYAPQAGQAAAGAAVTGSTRVSSSLYSGIRGRGFSSKGAEAKLKERGDELKRQALDTNLSTRKQNKARQELKVLEERAKPYKDEIEKKGTAIYDEVKNYGAASPEILKNITEAKKAVGAAREKLTFATTPQEREEASKALKKAQEDQNTNERRRDREVKNQQAQYLYTKVNRAKDANFKSLSGVYNLTKQEAAAVISGTERQQLPELKKASEKFAQGLKPATEQDEAKIKADDIKDELREAIKISDEATRNAAVAKIMKDLKPQVIKNLPSDVKTNSTVIRNYDAEDLSAMKKDLSKEDRKKVYDEVRKYVAETDPTYKVDTGGTNDGEKGNKRQMESLKKHLQKNKDA